MFFVEFLSVKVFSTHLTQVLNHKEFAMRNTDVLDSLMLNFTALNSTPIVPSDICKNVKPAMITNCTIVDTKHFGEADNGIHFEFQPNENFHADVEAKWKEGKPYFFSVQFPYVAVIDDQLNNVLDSATLTLRFNHTLFQMHPFGIQHWHYYP